MVGWKAGNLVDCLADVLAATMVVWKADPMVVRSGSMMVVLLVDYSAGLKADYSAVKKVAN